MNRRCTRCLRPVIGAGQYCLVHGDQLAEGTRASSEAEAKLRRIERILSVDDVDGNTLQRWIILDKIKRVVRGEA